MSAGSRPHAAAQFPAGEGELAELIQTKDWSSTPLGPIESWPAALKCLVESLVNTRHPMFLFWGPELTQFYNDAFRPCFGHGKHPQALGQGGRECWSEVWSIIGPQIEGVMSEGCPNWHENALVPILRNGRLEEVYWTYSYSAVYGEDRRVAGVLVVCTETTAHVLASRRQRLLRVAAENFSATGRPQDVADGAFVAIAEFKADIPFAIAFDDAGVTTNDVGLDIAQQKQLEAFVGRAPPIVEPHRRELNQPIDAGPWPEPVTAIFVVPTRRSGVMVFGLSSRLTFDDTYREFLVHFVESMATAETQSEGHAILQASHDERVILVQELEAASRAKDEFLALLGHELRNPLAPIVSGLELMRGKADGVVPHELALIERHVVHLVRLVDDLLDLARIARGKIDLACEPMLVGDVINKALEMTADAFVRNGQHVTVVRSQQPMPWFGDPVRIGQVIANLLTNAARYTNPGGRITLSTYQGEDYYIVEVADDGMGIAPEVIPHIFEMFVQGVRMPDRTDGGLGLGLTLVKNLVELHGGTVAVASPGLGRGSTFSIYLPRDTVPQDIEGPDISVVLEPTRVLVVDDNVDAAETLAELLDFRGHSVKIAHDGSTALELFQSFDPEVAVLDIGLPDIDGYEVLRRARAAGAENCRFVALTGYGQQHNKGRSQAAGFAVHLVKPVKFADLLEAMTTS